MLLLQFLAILLLYREADVSILAWRFTHTLYLSSKQYTGSTTTIARKSVAVSRFQSG
jgi:hypothetical protein